MGFRRLCKQAAHELDIRLTAHYGGNSLQLSRARYIFLLNIITSLIILTYVVTLGFSGSAMFDFRTKMIFCPLLLGQVLVYGYSNWKLLKGSFVLAQGMVVGTSVWICFGSVFLTGGFPGSVALPALFLPACITYLLVGGMAGLWMAGGTCLAVAVQWIFTSQFGVVLPDFTSQANPGLNVALTNLTVLACTIATIALYESANRTLRLQLDHERGRLAALARMYELTGLENLRGFNLTLETEIEKARIGRSDMAVLYLDLEYFKEINDIHGHDAGDSLLAATGKRIVESMRVRDVAARLGGDEFADIMPAPVDRSEVDALAERLRAKVTLPITYKGHDLAVGVSIGTEIFTGQAITVSELIKSVDAAMYRDKLQKNQRLPSPRFLASDGRGRDEIPAVRRSVA